MVTDSLITRFEYVKGSAHTTREANFTTQPNEVGSRFFAGNSPTRSASAKAAWSASRFAFAKTPCTMKRGVWGIARSGEEDHSWQL